MSVFSKPSTSVFPVEIFGCIIDRLGEREFDQPFQSGQLDALRTCAVVCKKFSALCRVHIFGYIEPKELALSTKDLKWRLLHLTEVMEQDSSLKNHVRELNISLKEYRHMQLTDEQFDRWEAVLSSFPDLHCLTITQEDTELWIWSHFRSRLLNTYVDRGTLRSIHVRCFDKLPLADMLTSDLLRRVKIGMFELSEQYPTGSNITFFSIYNMRSFPLSVLHSFPNLETLEIVDVTEIMPGCEDSRTISFKLRELRVEDVGNMAQLFNFFYAQALAQQTRAVARLETLTICAAQEWDVWDISALLEQTSTLKSLKINTSCNRIACIRMHSHFHKYGHLPPGFISQRPPNLTTNILARLPSLTNLFIDTIAFGFIDIPYNIIAMFTAIAANNMLQSLIIVLYNASDGDVNPPPTPFPKPASPIPPSAPLSQLASLLASTSAFPHLNVVQFELHLFRRDSDKIFQVGDDDREARQYLTASMSDLVGRKEIESTSRVHMCCD